MNLSTTLSGVSEDQEDTVVDMWPQVSHKVHIIIGVSIGVSGETNTAHRILFTMSVSKWSEPVALLIVNLVVNRLIFITFINLVLMVVHFLLECSS